MLRQILEKLVGGIAIGVFGAVALFARVGDQPRLWDVLSARFADASTVQQNGPNVIWVDAQRPTTRMMVTADSSFAPQPVVASGAPAAASVAAAAPAPAPAKNANSWVRHLAGALAMFSITGPATERSSASVSAGSSSGSAPSYSAPPEASASLAAASKPAGTDAAATSYVNYGANSRSDIMSSASGPVYNFAGNKH